jgi:hypothetical protein
MRSVPFATALIAASFFVAGCSAEQPPAAAPAAPAATPAAAPAAPATQTEAVYGDEAPVAIDAPAQDDHGHAHDGEGDHAHNGEHAHEADGSHPDETGDHDHEDGSEPHDH